MAKLTGPLLSESAHGKIGQILTYSKRRTSPIVRDYRIPRKDATLDQWTQRHIIGLLTAQWQCSSDADKNVWNEAAVKKGLNMSGFNFFLKSAMSDLYTYHGLIGYWPMNEKTGDQVLDKSGNANHGVFDHTYSANNPLIIASFQKQYGNALSYEAVSIGVNVPDAAKLSPTRITFEAWVYPTTFTTYYRRIIDKTFTAQYCIFLPPSDANFTYMSLTAYISGAQQNINYGYLYTNIWQHVVFTYDGDRLRFYINGLIAVTGDSYPGDLDPGVGALGIGYNPLAGESFGGTIDEVRLYNRALSAAEIFKHYNLLRLDKQRQPLLIH
jgi:hypothetical protein